jgi:hypothetical protein
VTNGGLVVDRWSKRGRPPLADGGLVGGALNGAHHRRQRSGGGLAGQRWAGSPPRSPRRAAPGRRGSLPRLASVSRSVRRGVLRIPAGIPFRERCAVAVNAGLRGCAFGGGLARHRQAEALVADPAVVGGEAVRRGLALNAGALRAALAGRRDVAEGVAPREGETRASPHGGEAKHGRSVSPTAPHDHPLAALDARPPITSATEVRRASASRPEKRPAADRHCPANRPGEPMPPHGRQARKKGL